MISDFRPTSASTTIIAQNGLYASARLNPTDALKTILGGHLDWCDHDNVATSAGDYKVKTGASWHIPYCLTSWEERRYAAANNSNMMGQEDGAAF